jgi:hypothetical protein
MKQFDKRMKLDKRMQQFDGTIYIIEGASLLMTLISLEWNKV